MTRVLVVATAPVAAEEISSSIGDRYGPTAEFRVISAEPVEAIDEAVERYGADVLVVVTRISDEASWRESGAVESVRDQFDVPLTHLLVA